MSTRKKVLPVVLAAAITGEAVLAERHHDVLTTQPHTEAEIVTPAMSIVSSPSKAGGGARSATLEILVNGQGSRAQGATPTILVNGQ